ncbi:MAG TPA: ABC-type transport auxiliary lipoprotein family protein [Burkholderiales bacterium]
MRGLLFCLGFALLLAGCQTPPAPEDNFYRLLPVEVAPRLPAAIREAGLTVKPLRADSLYGERAVLYTEADQPRRLRQYHYHLWLYPPGQLIQEQLAASLRRSNPDSPIRWGERAEGSGYAVSGRVLRFERVVSRDGSQAVAELELTLETAGHDVLLRKTYGAEVAAPQGGMNGFGQAMEQALARIYGEFAGDLQRLK